MRTLFLLAPPGLVTMVWALGSSLGCDARGVVAGERVQWGPAQGCMAEGAP